MTCSECHKKRSVASDVDATILYGKVALSSILLYMLYVAVTCPCKPALYSCHLTEMYVATAGIVGVLVYFNGTKVMSYLQ